MDKGVTLIGMPASGKTTIGKILADKIDYLYLDVEDWISEHESIPITEVIKSQGLQYIHNLEQECIEGNDLYEVVVSTTDSIIHTDSIKKLKEETTVIMLDVPLPIIEERLIEENKNIRTENSLQDLYEENVPLYMKWADKVILCIDKTPEEIATEIQILIQ